MRVTVCEFPDEARSKEAAWAELKAHCLAEQADIVVLPEMPFCDWKMFTSREVDLHAWKQAVLVHDTMLARLGELGAGIVLSSRPVDAGKKRLNESFCWTAENGCRGGHCKYYLPDEPDGWEASWFDRGDLDFSPVDAGGLEVGFQICTELLFSEISRDIGRAGAHLIAAPRATSGHRRWRIAACMAAVMAGCFVATTNRRSRDSDVFSGSSLLISPEAEVLAETSAQERYVTVDIDIREADAAKTTYPRNIDTR